MSFTSRGKEGGEVLLSQEQRRPCGKSELLGRGSKGWDLNESGSLKKTIEVQRVGGAGFLMQGDGGNERVKCGSNRKKERHGS